MCAKASGFLNTNHNTNERLCQQSRLTWQTSQPAPTHNGLCTRPRITAYNRVKKWVVFNAPWNIGQLNIQTRQHYLSFSFIAMLACMLDKLINQLSCVVVLRTNVWPLFLDLRLESHSKRFQRDKNRKAASYSLRFGLEVSLFQGQGDIMFVHRSAMLLFHLR